MEALRFIKWWWNRVSHDDRWLLTSLLVVILSMAYAWFIAATGFAMVLVYGILTAITMLVVWGLQDLVLSRWATYKYQRDEEAARIVAKLRGR